MPYPEELKKLIKVVEGTRKERVERKKAGQEVPFMSLEERTDILKFHPDFQGERFRQVAEAVQGLKQLAEKYGLTLYQLVLTATLMHPGIDVAVIGIKTPEQIREALGAWGQTISREDYFAVRSILNIDTPAKIKDAKGVSK